MHPRTRNSFIHIEQRFTLAKAVNQDIHRAAVQAVRAQPQQMVEQPGDFGVHDPNVLRTNRHIHAQHFFNCHAIRLLVGHHRHIVEPIHVRQGLNVRFAFGELLSSTVQQANVWVCALDDFTIKLQHQTQNTMGSRMLRPKIERVILDFSHERK